MSDPSADQARWLCGEPGWYNTKRVVECATCDEAALQHARTRYGSDATVNRAGKCWYDVTHSGWTPGTTRTIHKAFRVQRAPDQTNRGVDEGAARRALLTLHGQGWFIPEASLLGAGWTGTPRADLLVLPDGQPSTAYEIKTERDSLTRLPRQIESYQGFASATVLALTPRHLTRALTLIPDSWGVALLDPNTHQLEGLHRPAQPSSTDPVSGVSLIEELWAAELNDLLAAQGQTGVKRLSCFHKRVRLRGVVKDPELRRLALDKLAQRSGTRVYASRFGDE